MAQTTALKKAIAAAPFVGHLVSFRKVTGRARNNKVFGAIGTTARQWDNMVNMIIVANLDAAIIALTLLGFILTFNISGSVSAHGIALSCLATTIISAVSLSVGGAPWSIAGENKLSVGNVIGSVSCFKKFFVSDPPHALAFSDLFGVGEAVGARVLDFTLPVSRIIVACFCLHALFVGYVISLYACFAFAVETVLATFVARKVLGCGRLLHSAFIASFGWFWGIMKGHRERPFSVSNPGTLQRRPVFSLLATPSIIPQMEVAA